MTGDVDITGLLAKARAGERDALNAVFPAVYTALHDIAHRELRRWRPGETLHTTALVHEAYFRLVDSPRVPFADRRHFLAVAATAMRHILVDYVRERAAAKRGHGVRALSLGGIEVASVSPDEDILALDEALTALGREHPRLAQVVECRFFAGFSVEETAEALELSPRTVKREWQKARAFLFRALRDGSAPAEVVHE